MAAFLTRRLLQGVFTVLGVTILTFLLLHMQPGGPAGALLGTHTSPAAVRALNHSLSLDKPLVDQYGTWLWRLLHLQLGQSYQEGQPVSTLIANNLVPTVTMAGSATALSLLIAIPMGAYQAQRRNQLADHGLTVVALVAYSTPIFWLGLIFITLFSLQLGVLPSGGLVDPGEDPSALGPRLVHLVLPVATLTVAFVATWTRYIRSSVIDALLQDYIRTARAKGMSTGRLLLRHALPNGLIPTITLVGTSIPFIVSGSLVAEVVFNYEGMGYLFWQAAQARDFSVLLGIITLLGVLTVAGNLLADVANATVDPRIRRAGST